jgi:hypothetical protein
MDQASLLLGKQLKGEVASLVDCQRQGLVV